MKPKQKAIELVEKFMELNKSPFITYQDKKCALICVNEIIKSHNPVKVKSGWNFEPEYWNEVKQEIEKL